MQRYRCLRYDNSPDLCWGNWLHDLRHLLSLPSNSTEIVFYWQLSSTFRALSEHFPEQFQSSFRALSEHFPEQFPSSFRAVSEQFPSSFRALTRAVSERFPSTYPSSFRAVSEQFPSSFRAKRSRQIKLKIPSLVYTLK